MSAVLKDTLFEQVARIGKALSSPKRLQMIERLSQSERTVDVLANELGITIKLASAHLKVLKSAHLIEAHRSGRFIAYRLTGSDVAVLWANLHSVATEHLVDLSVALTQILAEPERLTPHNRLDLLRRARSGEVTVIDVRPTSEYEVAHLPHARSIPLHELKRRLAEIPKEKEVIAYCRGPFCVMSNEAATFLKKRGYKARKIGDGVAEWLAAGLPIETAV